MKRIVITLALLALLLGAGQLTAQTPRYKVVFIGTSGGQTATP